jgi:hypothetical protein
MKFPFKGAVIGVGLIGTGFMGKVQTLTQRSAGAVMGGLPVNSTTGLSCGRPELDTAHVTSIAEPLAPSSRTGGWFRLCQPRAWRPRANRASWDKGKTDRADRRRR